jgi:hypothetical protein
MNRQKTKALEFQAQLILIDWIRTLVPEDQKEEVTLSNVMELAPAFSYYSRDNRGTEIAVFHPRWIKQKLKRILKRTNLKLN